MVHRFLPGEEPNLEELKELCETAGYQVVYQVAQERYPHPQYNIGPGKVKELKKSVNELGIKKIVFENELKPVQEYNLAKELGVEVIDRIRLILEIFTLHASSLEARLQIKLASLKYELPRAKEKVRLAKKGEQPGFHGLGAYEANVYYEEINRRIQKIQERLEKIMERKRRELGRRKRSGVPTIALTGYTNAGKSTLFSRLTEYPAEISSKLFTTLSTKRRLTRILGRPYYVSDTVGFIKNVPALLISAFHSTLMEVAEADLVLLLVDASLPLQEVRERLAVSLSTLRQIGVLNIPVILALNKCDLIPHSQREMVLKSLDSHLPAVMISAKTGENLDSLYRLIDTTLRGFITFRARIPLSQLTPYLFSQLHTNGRVDSVMYTDEFVEIKASAPPHLAEKIRTIAWNGGSFIVGEH
ncbi:MAG: GTPase HflX [Candidatus Caldarchaeales archaeon]|nr:GTPase HflX [Candidatus Caldarchaeales archaeon]